MLATHNVVSLELRAQLANQFRMPRKQIPPNGFFPYHVCSRSLNRDWFEIPIEEVWKIFENYLAFTARAFELRIHAFVLMANHFHLIVTSPNANLGEAMRYLMRETSRELSRSSHRINQHWGGRYHRSLIPNFHHYMNVYKYVYRNPVRAGLCRRSEDYEYSSLNRLCGAKPLYFPLCEDTLLFEPEFSENLLAWINTPSRPEHVEQIRKALRRTEFKIGTERKTGRASDLETSLM